MPGEPLCAGRWHLFDGAMYDDLARNEARGVCGRCDLALPCFVSAVNGGETGFYGGKRIIGGRVVTKKLPAYSDFAARLVPKAV